MEEARALLRAVSFVELTPPVLGARWSRFPSQSPPSTACTLPRSNIFAGVERMWNWREK